MDINTNKEEFSSILQIENKRIMTKQEGQKFQQFFCSIIVSIGALLIGSVLAWTSPSLKLLADENSTTPLHITTKEEASWIAAWTPIGAIIGALPAGFFANTFGRKMTLIGFTIPWIGMWLMTAMANTVGLLYVSRFITGIIVGLFCAILPLYVNEIAEDSVRGTLGTLFQLFLSIGILFDYLLGVFESYDIINYSCLAVTIVFFCLLFLLPETPTHLLKKNRRSEAQKVLKRLRGPYYDVESELNTLKNTNNSDGEKVQSGPMFTKVNIKALTISVGLMLGQQFTGINGVIFFAAQIFEAAKASNPTVCSVIIGVVQTAVTIVSSVLVEKAGRKILLIISGAGMAVSLLALGYFFYLQESKVDVSNLGWLPLSSLVSFVIVFSLGFGPLPWLMIGEVCSPQIKGLGSSMATATNWIGVSIVAFFFQPLCMTISTGYTFWLFSIVAIVTTVWVVIMVPETKGKSIQQIQNELAGKKSTAHNGKV